MAAPAGIGAFHGLSGAKYREVVETTGCVTGARTAGATTRAGPADGVGPHAASASTATGAARTHGRRISLYHARFRPICPIPWIARTPRWSSARSVEI